MINKEIYCRRQHRVRNMFYFFYSYIQKKYFLVFLSKQWRKVIFIPFLPFRPIFFNCLYCNYVCTRLHGSTIILLKEVQYTVYSWWNCALEEEKSMLQDSFQFSFFCLDLPPSYTRPNCLMKTPESWARAIFSMRQRQIDRTFLISRIKHKMFHF